MPCPKNPRPRSLFFFNVMGKGPHDYESSVNGWAFQKFQITRRCRLCGCSDYDFGIEHEAMLDRGFDPEFLNYVKYKSYGMTVEEWQAELALKAETKAKERR